MKKYKILLLAFLFLFLPLGVNAKNALTLDEDKTVQAGEEAKFQLGIVLDKNYNDKVQKITFDVVVESDQIGQITSAKGNILSNSNWTIKDTGGNISYDLSASPALTDQTGVSGGDHLLDLIIPVKTTALEGKIVVAIKNVVFQVLVPNPEPKPEDPELIEAYKSFIPTNINAEGITKAINVTKIVKSNVAKLKTLTVSIGELTPAFNPKVFSYEVIVKDTINKLTIEAICEENCSSINGAQNQTYRQSHILVTGENEPIKISVISEDGLQSETYVVNVFRGEKSEEKADLKSLTIEGFDLDPEFKSEVYTYYIRVPFDTENLNINHELFDTKSKVTIEGSDNLKAGEENQVKIIVKSEDGKLEHNYIIYVTKDEETSSSSEEIISPIEEKQENKEKKSNIWLIILIIVLALTIIALAFYFIFKKKNKNNEVDVEDLKDTVGISHDDDEELLEYTKEYTELIDNITEESKPKRTDSDDYGKL